MLRQALLSVVVVGLLVGFVRADGALPVKTLKAIKDATVFIRTEKENVAAASGSGFLIRVDGETAYIVTNHHVVHLTKKVEARVPQLVLPPRIRPGRPPMIPTPAHPGIEYRTEIVEIAVPDPNLTLVFSSGTKKERSVKAEVVASDPEADLAVLRVTGCKDLPEPINLQSPEVVETMQVYVFGFPFGKTLAIDKDNPAVSVNKAAVSSIRTDKSGDVKIVQFDGDVNPGNSGGPVVDENGHLVGIVVAKVRNTQIGLAIPTQQLHVMLAGRAAPPKLTPTKVEKGTLEVQVEVPLIDPLEQIKSITLHYAPTGTVTEAAKKSGLAEFAESKTVKLQRDKQKATGTFSVTLPEKAALDLTYQVSYVRGEGKTILSELKASALTDPTVKAEVKPPDPTVKTPIPPPPVEEKFDAAALAAVLRPSKPDDRGPLVGVALQPLAKGKPLTADELATAIADLQTPDKAQAAVKRLQGAEVDPKHQAEVARLLEKLAGNKDLNVFARADAATALRRWGTAESVEALLPLVSDPNVHSIHYRHPAMWSMAYLGGEKATAAIASRLGEFVDRGGVSSMLQQMGSAVEPQILTLLEDKRAEVRVEAAKILKTVGTKASAPALFKAAEEDQNESVRKEARDALRTIAGRQKN